jgi:hypothetical protein
VRVQCSAVPGAEKSSSRWRKSSAAADTFRRRSPQPLLGGQPMDGREHVGVDSRSRRGRRRSKVLRLTSSLGVSRSVGHGAAGREGWDWESGSLGLRERARVNWHAWTAHACPREGKEREVAWWACWLPACLAPSLGGLAIWSS